MLAYALREQLLKQNDLHASVFSTMNESEFFGKRVLRMRKKIIFLVITTFRRRPPFAIGPDDLPASDYLSIQECNHKAVHLSDCSYKEHHKKGKSHTLLLGVPKALSIPGYALPILIA